tara:strand:+ start:1297 stop:1659 length:363 start_codon:yes stop_codon:yes gene_type:complete
MDNYFKEGIKENKSLSLIDKKNFPDIPLKVKESSWKKSDSCKQLEKIFYFKEKKIKETFIVELIKYQREIVSNLEIVFRKEDFVLIRVITNGPEISEIEIESTKDIDKIRKDVVYYFAKK